MSQATLPESRDNRPSCHTAPLAFSRGKAMIPEAALTAPEASPVHPNYLGKRTSRASLGSVWVCRVDLLTQQGDDRASRSAH